MSRYEGLNAGLRRLVHDRDGYRCRWCGATNRGIDLHHIRYRRGAVDDVADNLVSLCRHCHGFVHGARTAHGDTITKTVATEVLVELTTRPGWTGSALWRIKRKEWQRTGACMCHGVPGPECVTPDR